MTKRVEWVDIAKYVCIMCVMASHLESMTGELRALFSPFFLTLFFFCSGYVYKQRDGFIGLMVKKYVSYLFLGWYSV